MSGKTLVCAFGSVALLFAVAGTTKLAFAAVSEIEDFRADVRQAHVSAMALCDAQFLQNRTHFPKGESLDVYTARWREYQAQCVADLLERERPALFEMIGGRIHLLIAGRAI